MTMTNQNPEPLDPEAWYAARKAEFAEALPSVGVTTDVAVQGLSALYDADLRSLVPDPGNQLSGELAAWFHDNRLDYVRRQVEALLGEDV